MPDKHLKKAFQEQLQDLCPLVDTLRLMIGAARHAFNRHSQAQLEEMARLRKTFTLEIDPFFQYAEKGLPKGAAADRTHLQKFKEILTHLELMAEKIGGLAEHLRYKAKTGAILSDHDFYAVNNLFSTLTGFMRALVDIFELNDPALKAYVLEETRKLTDDSFRSATAHETGMADNPGQSKAWSVYLAIISASREIAGRLAEIVKSLD